MPRNVRSYEERVITLDEKIFKRLAKVAKLEEQKYRLLHPFNIKTIIVKAKEAGLTYGEIARKLEADA